MSTISSISGSSSAAYPRYVPTYSAPKPQVASPATPSSSTPTPSTTSNPSNLAGGVTYTAKGATAAVSTNGSTQSSSNTTTLADGTLETITQNSDGTQSIAFADPAPPIKGVSNNIIEAAQFKKEAFKKGFGHDHNI